MNATDTAPDGNNATLGTGDARQIAGSGKTNFARVVPKVAGRMNIVLTGRQIDSRVFPDGESEESFPLEVDVPRSFVMSEVGFIAVQPALGPAWTIDYDFE